MIREARATWANEANRRRQPSMKESPPGFIFQDGAYICVACGCLCPDSWTILQAHKDFHEALNEAFAAAAVWAK